LEEDEKLSHFEQAILPHMDAAYNLARWLARNEQDAQDVVQEAYLRAFRFFGGYRGGSSRAWLLKIVRNTFYTWAQQNRMQHISEPFDEQLHAVESDDATPATVLLKKADSQLVRRALEELPIEFRETLVMRELEGMSYKEIADIADIPLGTVMSRLARGRKELQKRLMEMMEKET
jgi:RNA polymerase sigma-70 factor (ECF subfamily)